MIGKLRNLFGKKPVVIPDSAKLLEGEARTVDVGDPLAGGLQVVLCRVDGVVHALDARCPHDEGGRIQRGPLEQGRYAVCPLHGYKFDPATGQPQGVACKPARRLKCVERDGAIELHI